MNKQQTKNPVDLVDFSEQIKAATTTTCDSCGKVLGESWMRGRDNIAIHLLEGKDEQGYENYKTYHTCGEDCLRNLLNSRKKA